MKHRGKQSSPIATSGRAALADSPIATNQPVFFPVCSAAIACSANFSRKTLSRPIARMPRMLDTLCRVSSIRKAKEGTR